MVVKQQQTVLVFEEAERESTICSWRNVAFLQEGGEWKLSVGASAHTYCVPPPRIIVSLRLGSRDSRTANGERRSDETSERAQMGSS